MGRVFLLGAGASRFARYPLASGLWDFIGKFSGGHSDADHRREAASIAMGEFSRIAGGRMTFENLEGIITCLDLASRGIDPHGLLKAIDWASVRPKLLGMIADAFMWYEYCLQQELVWGRRVIDLGLDVQLTEKILQRWADHLRSGDTVISFNWDLLHEAALFRKKKWHFSDGYGFLEAGTAVPEEPSQVSILKLHGSVNWAQRDEMDCQPSIEHKKDFFFPGSERPDDYTKGAQWSSGRELMLPTYIKDLSSNSLLLRLWNQAYDRLCEAEELTVIGFGLNAADAQARQLLGSALLRNKKLDEINIVLPGGYNLIWDDFCLRVKKTPKWGRQSFEAWV